MAITTRLTGFGLPQNIQFPLLPYICTSLATSIWLLRYQSRTCHVIFSILFTLFFFFFWRVSFLSPLRVQLQQLLYVEKSLFLTIEFWLIGLIHARLRFNPGVNISNKTEFGKILLSAAFLLCRCK